MKKHVQIGAALIGLGVFFIYWAQMHSPKQMGKMLGNAMSGSYTMSETSYYVSLALGIVIGIYGVMKIMKKA
jgi:hypothetical protein